MDKTELSLATCYPWRTFLLPFPQRWLLQKCLSPVTQAHVLTTSLCTVSPVPDDVWRGTPNCQIYFRFVSESKLSFSILPKFHTLRNQELKVRVIGSFQAPTQMRTASQTAVETYFFPFM